MQGGSSPGARPGTTTPYPYGSVPAPLTPEELAPFFPQLDTLELLGQGGMGVVYKARQVRLDRLVALKILPPELGRDPAFAERFAREARALARLSHPRIVGVHDFGESGGLFYLLMEFVHGVNLRGLLRQGRLKPEEALRIVPQICEALQYAHEEGIVHRDIKPENILLDSRGNVKIADFGLAKLLGTMSSDSALTGSQQVIGTLRYMAPEQMERPLTVDHRADIYSLGVVFYEMLTGELPLGRFAPPSKRAEVDVRLDEVVLRALEKEPERRYQHASEVKTDVDSLAIPPGPAGAFSSPGSQGEDRGRPIATAAEGWQPWPLLVLIIGLYGASLFAPTVWIGGGVISYGPGYQFVFEDLKTYLLLFGSWSLMTRRWLAAGIAGLIATGWTLYGASRHAHLAPLATTWFFDLPGYQMGFTSTVLLAGAGFYRWRRSRHEAWAGDVRTTLPEVGPPKPDPTRDLDGP